MVKTKINGKNHRVDLPSCGDVIESEKSGELFMIAGAEEEGKFFSVCLTDNSGANSRGVYKSIPDLMSTFPKYKIIPNISVKAKKSKKSKKHVDKMK